MTQDDMPMWEDPRESSALRQLLRAGRVENSDYDVERGLARHLAQLQAGAPVPAWAVQTTLHKSAGWSVLAWILPPMISAAVVGAWLAIRPAEPTALAAAAAREAASQEFAATTVVAPASDNPDKASQVSQVSQVNKANKANKTAPVAADEPAVAVAAAPSPDREALEQRDRRDHHVVATGRSVRPAARAVAVRRGRTSRSDDSRSDAASATYGSASLGQGAGAASNTDSAAAVSASSSSAGAAAVSSKAAPQEKESEELAAKQEPAVEEPKAKEAKAKPERRTKEEDAAQDEVTGARLEREMRMLAVAQRVLTEDPERSLRLCRQGESEFRGSMFSAERKQVALLALVQLGRLDQARREGIPFLRAYPNAPWSARLREALSSGHLPNR